MEAIYDRNLLDITNAKELRSKILSSGWDSLTTDEQTTWNSGMKGFLNYTDLNRIEENCQTIADLLGIEITTKTDWQMGSLNLTATDMARIRANVALIRSYNFTYSTTPTTPVLPLNTYAKINNIEKILYDAYTKITENAVNINYVDEIYADETIGVI